MAELTRLSVDARFQERREPHRALVVRAALLDLIVEALESWARREPDLAAALIRSAAHFEHERSEIDGNDSFQEEVEVLRSSLRQ